MKLVRLRFRGWAVMIVTAACVAVPGAFAVLGGLAHAGGTLEERKLPMQFSWVACQPHCGGWISAVGIVTAESPKDFEDFAQGRDLRGATIVLDSSGGSVNDSITLGRRFRNLGLMTTVGTSVRTHTTQGDRGAVDPQAYCELMCVFLLLSGKARYVPETAHVRVHQIWMGDRAEDARAASYSADDLMIVERDIGRLAKYTFEMGGGGDLLSLSLNVPPWEELHELSRDELRLTNLVTTDAVARSTAADGWPGHARRGAGHQAGPGPFHEFGGERGSRAGCEIHPDRRGCCAESQYRGRAGAVALIHQVTGALQAEAGCAVFSAALSEEFLASIWPIASTTASKVSMVEACRAL